MTNACMSFCEQFAFRTDSILAQIEAVVRGVGVGGTQLGIAARFPGLVRVLPAVRIEPLEVWIGGHAPAAVDRAARLGDGWLAGPEATPDHARALVTTYLERCAARDRTPTAVAIRRDIHVGADDADAERVAGPVLARGYRGFDTSACVVGGPERVAEQLRELATMGYTDVIVRHLADEQAEVLASLARLAGVRAAILDA